MTEPDDDEYDSPKQRTGRFSLQHRGGTRVEVGEPIHLGTGAKPWMCAVKLIGQKRDDIPQEPEPTQTLLVRTGRGATPEEAQREAMAQLTLVYGSPVGPPPAPVISNKVSDPPPGASTPPPRTSWIDKLKGFFKGE
jgi:hypothetical protein